MLPFWISIALLSLAQGAVVALPQPPRALSGFARARAPAGPATAREPLPSTDPLRRLRGGRWGLLPPASVIAFVFIVRAAERASAQALTYLALCARQGTVVVAYEDAASGTMNNERFEEVILRPHVTITDAYGPQTTASRARSAARRR